VWPATWSLICRFLIAEWPLVIKQHKTTAVTERMLYRYKVDRIFFAVCISGIYISNAPGPVSAQELDTQPYNAAGYIEAGGGPIKNGAKDLNCDFTKTCCWSDDDVPNAEVNYVLARDDTFLRESAFATYFPSSPKPGT